jgi:hypothetical protein
MTGLWRDTLTRECDFLFQNPGWLLPSGANQYEPVLIFALPSLFTIAGPNFEVRHRLLEDSTGLCQRRIVARLCKRGIFAQTLLERGPLVSVKEFGGYVQVGTAFDSVPLTTTVTIRHSSGTNCGILHARTRDHEWFFQCDLCHFRNIMDANPWLSKWQALMRLWNSAS